VRAALEGAGGELRACWGGGTLFHADDLPFGLKALPAAYGDFRAKIARLAVRPEAEAPAALRGAPAGAGVEPGALPTMAELGFAADALPPARGRERAALGGSLRGGEGEALRHLTAFLADVKRAAGGGGAAAGAAAAAGGAAAFGARFTAQISPWLAMGCLSPRTLYHRLRRAVPLPAAAGADAPAPASAVAAGGRAAPVGGADGANWLVFELMWRDFFRFVTRKYSDVAPAGLAAGGASALAHAPALAPALALA